ncbi:uncharacterized protein LOC124188067 [Neodiprion fabricii]|uniref:uncharacterized protein LOC124188067 n=1 Tax=Neodiprion fabricii TaxID=2872261 RepID=UPI001ED9202D|nr:uncharacterized protein LOC124188067 [Neodiprion fabricii]
MPKRKEPALLQDLAFDSMVSHCVDYCQKTSCHLDSKKLRKCIAKIKSQLFPLLPPNLSLVEDFCIKFFEVFKLTCWERSAMHRESYIAKALEIMMDVKIPNLRCSHAYLNYLDCNDFHRFRGLESLEIETFPSYDVSGILEYFCLENLRELYLPQQCNNNDLAIIGSCCPLLQVLDVSNSPDVDDYGLQALQPCSDLRVLDFCFWRVSNVGVNDLLSAHPKLEELNARKTVRLRMCVGLDFDLLSRPLTMVCPSMKRYCVRFKPVTNEILHALITLFPNLTYLRIFGQVEGDLRLLQKLKMLNALDFSGGVSHPSTNNLRELLTIIGANISSLDMKNLYCVGVFLTQDDMNFLYESCKNVEYLTFVYERSSCGDKLVVPPFPKLKELDVEAKRFNNNRFPSHAEIEFGVLNQLETLRFENFGPIAKITESIMFDHVRFPNLKKVLCEEADEEGMRKINKIAKDNNLDFTMECQPWPSAYWDRLGFMSTGWILH